MGGENKGGGGESRKNQQHLTASSSSSSPKDHPAAAVLVQESTTDSPVVVGVTAGPPSFLSPPPPLYIPTHVPTTASSFEQQQQFELGGTGSGTGVSNPKRPRYTAGQWKLLPSPPQKQTHHHHQINIVMSSDSTPSPSPHTTVATIAAAAASSSDTAASSPSHPSLSGSAASAGQEYTNKPTLDPGGDQQQHHHLQFRKGKYVSPVWKPNEMLCLARAWRVQYQGGGCGGGSGGSSSDQPPQAQVEGGAEVLAAAPSSHGRGTKTRADKDREVAEFLNRHGVNRDAKTAGTKWDNMLGEFRKVYEWERGGERDQIGKSYFRLSPYERKLHRLPASFDEEVFEELSQFMGSRMRTPHTRPGGGASSATAFISAVGDDTRSSLMPSKPLPPPPPFREDHDLHLSGRGKQVVLTSGGEAYLHGGRGSNLLGFDSGSSLDVTPSKELRRIGKVRMIWEESVSLWAEEGEHHRGRVKVQGSSFLNADELAFLDDSMVACTMEAFEEATNSLKGFSVDRFVCGQQVKVFGRRKSSSSAPLPPTPTAPSVSGIYV